MAGGVIDVRRGGRGGGVSGLLLDAVSRVGASAWEVRRALYARGWKRPRRVSARVVSVGNLTVGGTGKTTLTRHLAEIAAAAGRRTAVVCRRYRPGPDGEGDEERLLRAALPGIAVHAGVRKVTLAAAAAAAGAELVLVDDGFSHWSLERDVDIVLVEARDCAQTHRMLPAGPLREPWRALQRATFVVASRLDPGEDPARVLECLARRAPAAALAAGRHEVRGARTLDGTPVAAEGRVRVVTATGNPESVARTAREAGFTVAELSAYRDHHWFTRAEADAERASAGSQRARILLTAKDAVRWPLPPSEDTWVLEVAWRWVTGGEAVERALLDPERE
ncbi:MAG: tetraacyldisaccharide 4'-kinase [Candidatus Eisenbacteria bacterium]